MPTIDDFATKYANLIYQSKDKLSAITDVKSQIKNLTSNGNPLSLDLQENLWDRIEKQLFSKQHGLFENQNINYLSVVSAIKREIKLKKSTESKGNK